MYGEAAVVQRRVAELREQATDIRAAADKMVAQAEQVAWTGRAADSMRTRVKDRAAQLRKAAAAHDTAADSLTKHQHEVTRLKDSIANIEAKSKSLIMDAEHKAERHEARYRDEQVRPELGEAERRLLDFEPPPSGHKDWLTVSLPGL